MFTAPRDSEMSCTVVLSMGENEAALALPRLLLRRGSSLSLATRCLYAGWARCSSLIRRASAMISSQLYCMTSTFGRIDRVANRLTASYSLSMVKMATISSL
jgi:hypothetical protein